MRSHETDWTALVSGAVFVAIGLLALALGQDRFTDALPAVWATTFLGLGAALLLRSARAEHGLDDRASSARQYGSSDEIGAERGEDRQVEQPGSSHDG
jgi:hypothetical protein